MISVIPNEHVRLIGGSQEGLSCFGGLTLPHHYIKRRLTCLSVGWPLTGWPKLEEHNRGLLRIRDGSKSTSAVLFERNRLVPGLRVHDAILRDAKLATQRLFSGLVPVAIEETGRAA